MKFSFRVSWARAFKAAAIASKIRIAAWVAVLGLASGLACVGVRLTFRLLQWLFVQHAGLLPHAAASLSPLRRVITPILGAALATAVLWAVKRWANPARFEDYVDAVRHSDGQIAFKPTLWRTISSAFSVASGAAIGREGSMIQFAAAVTSWLGRHSPLRSIPLARQVSYGAAAAVAAAYQAPLAGVFFAIEIVLGQWTWAEIPALALASTAGWLVSRLLLGAGPLFAVHAALPLNASSLWAIPVALILGCVGPAYQRLLLNAQVGRRLPTALLWGGLLVGLLSLLRPEVWGNGDVSLLETLAGTAGLTSVALLLLVRLLATTFCVGTGTVGGVFTPTVYAGASLGLGAGYLLHSGEPVLLAIVGMSAFLAAVTHAPVMASLMAIELTGQYHLLPLLLACSLAAWLAARSLSPLSLYATSVDGSASDTEGRVLAGAFGNAHPGPAPSRQSRTSNDLLIAGPAHNGRAASSASLLGSKFEVAIAHDPELPHSSLPLRRPPS
jgi:chloride channel protein, CIC family